MKIFPFQSTILLFILVCLSVFVLPYCGQKEDNKSATDTEEPTSEEKITMATADTLAINNNQLINNITDNTKQGVTAEENKELKAVKKPDLPILKPETPDSKPVVTPVNPPIVKVPEPVKPAPVTPPVTPPVIVNDPKPDPVVIKPVDQNKWIVPTKYLNMANPYPANSESISTGRSLFSTHCKSCHGSKGDGNGTKAASLDTKIGSFLTSTFQAQKPGEIYYKSIFGRDDMPNYDKKIPDVEDRWALVNYLMSLQ